MAENLTITNEQNFKGSFTNYSGETVNNQPVLSGSPVYNINFTGLHVYNYKIKLIGYKNNLSSDFLINDYHYDADTGSILDNIYLYPRFISKISNGSYYYHNQSSSIFNTTDNLYYADGDGPFGGKNFTLPFISCGNDNVSATMENQWSTDSATDSGIHTLPSGTNIGYYIGNYNISFQYDVPNPSYLYLKNNVYNNGVSDIYDISEYYDTTASKYKLKIRFSNTKVPLKFGTNSDNYYSYTVDSTTNLRTYNIEYISIANRYDSYGYEKGYQFWDNIINGSINYLYGKTSYDNSTIYKSFILRPGLAFDGSITNDLYDGFIYPTEVDTLTPSNLAVSKNADGNIVLTWSSGNSNLSANDIAHIKYSITGTNTYTGETFSAISSIPSYIHTNPTPGNWSYSIKINRNMRWYFEGATLSKEYTSGHETYFNNINIVVRTIKESAVRSISFKYLATPTVNLIAPLNVADQRPDTITVQEITPNAAFTATHYISYKFHQCAYEDNDPVVIESSEFIDSSGTTNLTFTVPHPDNGINRSYIEIWETDGVSALSTKVTRYFSLSNISPVNEVTFTRQLSDSYKYNISYSTPLNSWIFGSGDCSTSFETSGGNFSILPTAATYTATNLPLGINAVSVKRVFNLNPEFNSTIYSTSFTTSILTTPVPSLITQTGNFIDSINNWSKTYSNVITGYNLTWAGSQYANSYKILKNDVSYLDLTTTSATISNSDYTIQNYKVGAIYNNNAAYNSLYSTAKTISRYVLTAPVLNITTGTTILNAALTSNSDANLYELNTSEGYKYVYTSAASVNVYSILKALTSTQSVSIASYSLSNNPYIYKHSGSSNAQIINVVKLDAPTNISLDIINSTVTWDAVPNAYKYKVGLLLSGTTWVYYDSTSTTFTNSDISSALLVSIQAVRNEDETQATPVYLNSDIVKYTGVGQLPPIASISLNNNILSWTTYDGNTSGQVYIIYDNGFSFTTLDNGGTSIALGKSASESYRPTEGNHVYTVQIRENINGVYVYSSVAESPTVNVNVSYLKTPVISYPTAGKSNISWDAQDANVNYNIYITNGETEIINQTGTSYTISKDIPNKYYIQVKSITNGDDFLFQTSELSNTLVYTVLKLDDPVISYTKNDNLFTVSWDAVPNAPTYHGYLNHNGEISELTISDTYYLITAITGTYSFKVYANGNAVDDNPRYLKSEYSNDLSFGILATPSNVRIENGILMWDAVQGTDYYEIYNQYSPSSTYSNYFYDRVNNNSYELNTSVPYTYELSVKAFSIEPDRIADSNISVAAELIIQRLVAPTNLVITNGILTFNQVTNAESYNLYIDDELYTTIDSYPSEGYDLSTLINTTTGKIKIYLTASNSSIQYLTSNNSLSLIYNIYENRDYIININGTAYNEIQLPFTIHRMMDGTLSTGALTLAYVDFEKPFEQLTPCKIWVYNKYSGTPLFSYDMLIESDRVEEVQKADISVYKHTLELIDRTLLTQNEIMQNFTVSQPSEKLTDDSKILYNIGTNSFIPNDYIPSVYDQSYPERNKTLDSVIFIEGATNFIAGEQRRHTGTHVRNGESITDNVYTSYLINTAINLPVEQGRAKSVALYWDPNRRVWSYGYPNYNAENLKIEYYIRPTKDNYDYTSDEVLIYSKYADNGDIPQYTFRPGYDGVVLDNNGEFNCDIILKIYNPNFPTHGYMRNDLGEETTYRVVWKGIKVLASSQLRSIKISTILNKAIDIANNNKTKEGDILYKLDPKINALTSSLVCPDLTISNGKYLYDVLSLLGKEFNGIPKLLADNTITFDILDSSMSSFNSPNFFTDDDVLEVLENEEEKNASGFIINAANMIPDNKPVVYPSSNLFTTCRADTEYSSILTLSSMAIILDKPIYRIYKVIVKYGSNEVDITNYIYESAQYNALNNDETGKGLALFYQQGDNKIRGLGQLPEESDFYAIMGWSSDKYVIQNIIKNKNSSLNPTTDECLALQYKIYYIPYISTTSYIENPNNLSLKYANYRNFNQEDNVISDVRLGNSATTQLKRLGNHSIKKTYKTTNSAYVPTLGYKTIIDEEPYYIDELSYMFANNYIQTTVNYSKNYNKLNPRTGVDSLYRQYDISADNIANRVINYNQYCYLTNTLQNYNSINNENIAWAAILLNSFNGSPYLPPDVFYINCASSSSGGRLSYTTLDTNNEKITENVSGIILPAAYSTISSSVQFTGKMLDYFSAGVRADKNVSYDVPGTGTIEKKVQTDVRYVSDDYLNQCPYVKANLGYINSYLINNSKINGYDLNATFPAAYWITNPQNALGNSYIDSSVFNSGFKKVSKDARECLNFNYQKHFLSGDSNLIIHKGITTYLFKNEFQTNPNKPIWVAYTGNITHQNTISGYKKLGTSAVEIKNLATFVIDKISFIADKTYSGLALIWPDTNEIIIEYRGTYPQANVAYQTPDIYFILSSKKLDEKNFV